MRSFERGGRDVTVRKNGHEFSGGTIAGCREWQEEHRRSERRGESHEPRVEMIREVVRELLVRRYL